MVEPQPAILSFHSNAGRHLAKLDRAARARLVDFQTKFSSNINQPGLRLKPLKGNDRLWSARVSDDYRAIMCRVSADHFILIAVKPRQSAYDGIDHRYDAEVNRVSGALEVVDHDDLARAVEAAERGTGEAVAPAAPRPAGLFGDYSDTQLVELGVSEPLMPSVRQIVTEVQLDQFCKVAPHLTGEVLTALQAGYALDEVREVVTAPVKAAEPVDTADLAAALDRPSTMVTSSDQAVAAMLDDGFAAWRLWTHPNQTRIIARSYNGPARVSGGPGTGKTVVAIHRTARLARAAEPDERVLLTTFTRNLATDLKHKLSLLLDPETLARVDVEHVDSLVYRLAADDGRNLGRRLDDRDLRRRWDAVCADAGETDLDGEFLLGEWTDVICAQLITSRAEYLQARRVRRPRRLNRLQRARVWDLTERFNQRLAADDAWCWPQLRASVAVAERYGAKGPRRYRHIVIDEAQDLTPAHWLLLRALAPEDTDDLFIAGDTYQRIYGQPVTLGRLGIDIRGRSRKLTLNYRTTREILRTALAIEADATADDLDGDLDSLAGYRSVMTGANPRFQPHPTEDAELAAIADQVKVWTAEHLPGSVAVTVPSNAMAEKVIAALNAEDITARPLTAEQNPGEDAVHVGTMHRLKGLEYRFMMISGIGAEHFPYAFIRKLAEADPQRHELEMDKARNLLFVAATRARDQVVFTWSGEPSPLLRLSGGSAGMGS